MEAEKTRLMVRVRAVGGPAWLFGGLRMALGLGDRAAHNSMFERIKARAEARYSQRLGVPVPAL